MKFLGWTAHPDPLTHASNKIALLLASNTPFYPVYLFFIVGKTGLPWILLAAAATPFFCATIPMARRNGLYGRAWLCLVATINTVYVTWLLGEASGTALFLIPCISLVGLSFRAREWRPMVVLAALPCALYLALHGRFPAPPMDYTAAMNASLNVLNQASVASITMVLAYVLGNAREVRR